MPLTKKKVKVDVTRGKGIELHSQAALTEDAQFEEVRRKSMRDFHKTHPSGSGTITKTTPSVANIKPSVTSGGTGVKPRVPNVAEEETFENNENELNSKHETDESESGSKSNHEDDEEEVKDEFVKTSSNNSDDKVKGDEDEEMDYTTSQLYDDVDIRLNAPVNTDKEFVQEERTDAVMTNIQQENENPEILQVIEDAHVTTSEKEVVELKKYDPLKTQVTALVDENLDAMLGATKDKFMNILSASIAVRITMQVKNQLPQILPKEVSNFAPTLLNTENDKTIFSTYGKVYSLKRSQKDKDEDPFAGSDQGLKKRKTSKDVEPAKGIEDMVPNIWSPVKVGYDKHALWGISHWRDQRKTFYGCARGLQSKNDVYSTKRISTVTGYLQEIVVRRADNNLYKFKEGDFLRLHTNDIEDMILFVVHNRLINLSGDDVSDFAIALRMFTRSLANQKRVEDL
uniref:Integrase, catalytic region, zinc finger, CCHC-type, peptidase aspartic, catalytic n=1 Tax=Tanacetum cinerariifolium TaxID=118510 RepID=A0A699JRD6_TANCI|nr:hypothetical protein [Tanacetum cinerariifolium]